jgi:hypothetical protein
MLLTLLATLSLAPATLVRLSVEGNGYLQFAQDGHALYTSSAPLTIVDGWLSYPSGAPLLPTLRVPKDTIRVDVDEDGNVFAATRRFRARVGRISLATFAPGTDLRRHGSFLVSSSLPKYKGPGDDNAGTIRVLDPDEESPATPVPSPTTKFLDPTVHRNDEFIQGWLNRKPDEVFVRTSTVYSGSAEITVSSRADVDTDQFTLGDIAVIDAEPELRAALMTAHVGNTPKPGKKLSIRRESILRRLESQGFDVDDLKIDIPRRAHLVRRGQKSSADAIKEAALQAASTIYNDQELKASMRMDSDFAPIGAINYEVESCVATSKGAVVIVVTKVDGERYKSHVVRVSAGGH